MIDRAFVWMLALCLALAPRLAIATQNELVPPTAGIYTGVQFSQKLGDAFRSLAGCNKGATAPANVGGSAVDGLCWLDDSSAPWTIKQYVNGGWAVKGFLDPTDSTFAGVVGGGLGSIASNATVDLGSVPQANVTITGTTTVSGFGSSAVAGAVKFIRFDNALTLVNSASLTVPGGFDLTTAAGDRAIVTHLGSGNWEVTQYTRTSGIPLDAAAVGKIEYGIFESVPPLHVAGYHQALSRSSYPAYLAKVTRAQNGTRTSGNATITGLSNTSGFGAGMPVEGTGIAAACTIASVTSSSITLNSAACVTSSGTSTVTVFLTGYGSGGSSSTVGAPDCRGRTLAGRDRNDPGTFANRLTSTYFGADSSIFNVAGGEESIALSLGHLPTGITAAGSNSISVTSTVNSVGYGYQRGDIGANYPGGAFWTAGSTNYVSVGSITSTGSNSISVTSNNTGGQAHRTLGPTLIAECVVRVTP